MGKSKLVRKHLFEADIQVLMELRGLTENKFAPLKGVEPVTYRPRTTKEEWKAILKARSVAQKEKEAEDKYVPQEAKVQIRRILKNNTLTANKQMKILTNHLKTSPEQIEKWIGNLNLEMGSSEFAIAKQKKIKKSKYYIFTSAQNASKCNVPFLRKMEKYAKFIGAEIGIIATRYRNPTSVWVQTGEVWDEAVHPYLTAKRHTLHPNLELLADLKIQATSPHPTNGIELFGGKKSCIVASPRIEMRTLPVLPGEEQKFLYATGTVTEPSFTDTVAGGKSQEHHSYGFVIVEVESDKVVHIRNVSAHKNGDFQDLIFNVTDDGITPKYQEGIVLGDSHFAQKDERVTAACRKMMKNMGSEYAVLHDIYDSESLNVHNAKNPVAKHELAIAGRDSIDRELEQMYDELDWFDDNINQTYVVSSNHDDMVDRSLIAGDWKDYIHNARTFVELLALKLSGKAKEGVIPYLINERYHNVRALGIEDSLIKHGIQLALHGHKGSSGAKGNILSFAKLPFKTITGHSHSPAIKWGAYVVGISCGTDHGYNKGLTTWAFANCLINDSGKRQLIVLHKDTLTYTTLLKRKDLLCVA